METLQQKRNIYFLFMVFTVLFAVNSCSQGTLDSILNPDAGNLVNKTTGDNPVDANEYYDKIYQINTHRARIKKGTNPILALDSLPKDGSGNVNWTTSVVEGYINPRGSIDPNVEDDPPFNLNILIEAKTPLMANVLFPHSIHTYWFGCKVCHPKIFLPEAGANPITMDEIWKGQWCGRCHGKVAFSPLMPRTNCVRCHTVYKGASMDKETWK